MTFRDYLIVMSIASSAAWLGWLAVLVTVDPSQSSFYGFVFFFATLIAALVGTFSIIGAGLRVFFRRQEIVSRHVSRSFRQAILFSGLIVAALLLLPHGLFRWWTMGLVMLTAACIELAFISSHQQKG